MAKVLVTEDYLEDIADAIRGKLSSSDTYTPGQMAGAIESIPTGGITPTGTINITENGTVDVTQYATANVNVSGGGGGVQANVYAIGNFNPNSNANKARSGGIQVTPRYDIVGAGIRFWARDTVCNVYVSDSNGNTIASKQNASVTAEQWNDVLFDTPVTLHKETLYIIWGSDQSSTMRYVNTSSIWSQFVTIGVAKYSQNQNTFPDTTEGSGSIAKYGVDLIIQISL